MRRPFYLLIALASITMTTHAQVAITEIVQSNVDGIMDDRNEYPDSWIELHNVSSQSINLANFSVGLTPNPSEAWTLLQKTIPSGGYALVYCDKEGTGLHTDFRLESGKDGAVYLFSKGQLVSSVTDIPKQPAPGIAYAYDEATQQWAYVLAPTPAAANSSPRALGVLPDPLFSISAGVYSSQQSLVLSLPDDAPQGSVVRYTIDGSEPTASSTVYTLPIAIIRSLPVRAKLFCDGWASPRSVTQSYIFPGHKTTLPIISIATDDRHLNDKKIGILVDGNYSSQQKNYQYDWRRPINLELFEPDDDTSASSNLTTAYTQRLNQLCETRVMGAASRGMSLKSLAVYAHKRFGQKRFNYEFFPDQRPGTDKFKSFLLRNAGNDFDYLYMRDAIIQRTIASHTDIDWQAWRPAIIYVNGVYRGILNIRDRSNDDNITTYYDGLEDIDMIKNTWELQHGTWDHYNAFTNFYNEHGHTWDEYSRWIDLDEYITVMAMNLYYSNFDFPGNNIVFWRPRTPDGRWRIIVKDTDYTLGIYDNPATYDVVKWINNADYDGGLAWANKWEHTRLFRRLMEDMDFRRAFLERSAIYMGDFMNDRGTRATWDAMYNLIRDEYPHHRELINRWWPNYSQELTKARSWLSARTSQHYNHLASYYSMGTPTPLVINAPLPFATLQGLRVSFNGVELSEGNFNGRFYEGSEIHLHPRPVTDADVEAYRRMKLCAEGALPATFRDDVAPQQVVGWRVTTIGSNGTQTIHEYDTSDLDITMPACACLQIVAITEEASAIEYLAADSSTGYPLTTYDLQGRASTSSRPAGIYLQSDGHGHHRKVVIR